MTLEPLWGAQVEMNDAVVARAVVMLSRVPRGEGLAIHLDDRRPSTTSLHDRLGAGRQAQANIVSDVLSSASSATLLLTTRLSSGCAPRGRKEAVFTDATT